MYSTKAIPKKTGFFVTDSSVIKELHTSLCVVLRVIYILLFSKYSQYMFYNLSSIVNLNKTTSLDFSVSFHI